MRSAVTVAEFYAQHVEDGRAMLRATTVYESLVWIMRATTRGRSTYWLCVGSADAIWLLDPTADVRSVRRQAKFS